MNATAGELQLEGLLRARPELRLALPYLASGRGPAQLALAAILQQWIEAVYTIREPSVAASKLEWWVNELLEAMQGHTHHPWADLLFGEAASGLDPALLREAVDAGLALRDSTPASDFAAQVAVAGAFHGALARVETRFCLGADADPTRAARLATLGHLLSSLLHLGDSLVENDGLPMRQLARHALQREALGEAGAARDAALRDQLAELDAAFAQAMSLPGEASLPCELTALADRRQLQRARRARQPLAVLADGRLRVGPRMAFHAWRAGHRGARAAGGRGA